jgi:phospholipase C
MKCFDPSRLPVLARLAQEFAICDHWFSSLPGPTHPNRWFVHCGTSGGYAGSGEGHIVIGGLTVPFPVLSQMTTIQHLLSMGERSWKVYFHDIPHSWSLMRLLEFLDHFGWFDSFKRDASSGSLPNYSFIEPRYFGADANDQHPPHDVRLGEQLIADVYNALRTSPQWDRCMLIVTYDEHGGLYDHVAPVRTISPDDLTAYDEFDGAFLSFKFNRLGVRVPAIVSLPTSRSRRSGQGPATIRRCCARSRSGSTCRC